MSVDKQKELPLVFAKTIQSFFPNLGQSLGHIKDPRMAGKIEYDLTILAWVGVFMFFLSWAQVETLIMR